MSRFPKAVLPPVFYIVVVKRRGRDKLSYGERLRDAASIALPGERFIFVRYQRGPELVGAGGEFAKHPRRRVR